MFADAMLEFDVGIAGKISRDERFGNPFPDRSFVARAQPHGARGVQLVGCRLRRI
jgi:hypothetical protein